MQSKGGVVELAKQRKMYSGLGINSVGSFMSAGAFFGLYEPLKRGLVEEKSEFAC